MSGKDKTAMKMQDRHSASDRDQTDAAARRFREELKRDLLAQREKYPLMNEEDSVKLVFQAMLGVGHLIGSEASALQWLQAEMDGLEADADEYLTEKLGPDWFRLNLRAAKARGIGERDIARMLFASAAKPPSFTRRDVYEFCVGMDGAGEMKAAAEQILDERRLPSHSEKYREAYRPAYRVLHRDFERELPHVPSETPRMQQDKER